jgi:hypothetical protein
MKNSSLVIKNLAPLVDTMLLQVGNFIPAILGILSSALTVYNAIEIVLRFELEPAIVR